MTLCRSPDHLWNSSTHKDRAPQLCLGLARYLEFCSQNLLLPVLFSDHLESLFVNLVAVSLMSWQITCFLTTEVYNKACLGFQNPLRYLSQRSQEAINYHDYHYGLVTNRVKAALWVTKKITSFVIFSLCRKLYFQWVHHNFPETSGSNIDNTCLPLCVWDNL